MNLKIIMMYCPLDAVRVEEFEEKEQSWCHRTGLVFDRLCGVWWRQVHKTAISSPSCFPVIVVIILLLTFHWCLVVCGGLSVGLGAEWHTEWWAEPPCVALVLPMLLYFYFMLRPSAAQANSCFFLALRPSCYSRHFCCALIFSFVLYLFSFPFWPSSSAPSSHEAPPASLTECMRQQQQQRHTALYWEIRHKIKDKAKMKKNSKQKKFFYWKSKTWNYSNRGQRKMFMHCFTRLCTKQKNEILKNQGKKTETFHWQYFYNFKRQTQTCFHFF